MAHQVVKCTHCSTPHSQSRCDACGTVIGRDGSSVMLQNIQLGGPLWELQNGGNGKTMAILCGACARTGVDLVALASTRTKQFPEVEV